MFGNVRKATPLIDYTSENGRYCLTHNYFCQVKLTANVFFVFLMS